MAARRREGMLLALCSKNNEEDVAEVFAAHPQMPLSLRDFAAQRINWESKGANLASLAAELELGLDSLILVDDNPKECTEAQTSAPQVLALPLPAQTAAIPLFLRHVWAFDRPRVTAEDQRRAEMYAQQADRTRAPPSRRHTGGVPRLAATESRDRSSPSGPVAAHRTVDSAHQPDECHLRTPHRGGGSQGRPRVPRGHCSRPLRRLRADGCPDVRGGPGSGGGYVPAELPRPRPRRRASYDGSPRPDRAGAGAALGAHSISAVAAEPAGGAVSCNPSPRKRMACSYWRLVRPRR